VQIAFTRCSVGLSLSDTLQMSQQRGKRLLSVVAAGALTYGFAGWYALIWLANGLAFVMVLWVSKLAALERIRKKQAAADKKHDDPDEKLDDLRRQVQDFAPPTFLPRSVQTAMREAAAREATAAHAASELQDTHRQP
jgi:biopolymer transport protein ExbB/TolQ